MTAVSQKLRTVKEPIDIVLPCRSKVKKWAFENAYTLIFLSVMFGITDALLIALAVKSLWP